MLTNLIYLLAGIAVGIIIGILTGRKNKALADKVADIASKGKAICTSWFVKALAWVRGLFGKNQAGYVDIQQLAAIFFYGAIASAIIFTVLRAFQIITWSWWWVCVPVGLAAVIIAGIFIFLFALSRAMH